ncbi:MAG: hypothetical protein A2751_04595 [Candidatus Doudnabacteria bacterium RIFCSPHIGHO2_01_FULL_46_14]|uniref:Agmatine deiminase n=1 Tax=Candidatus Doudnabacteria bacterium RIFCSPHIGHO2_01_FULL_46_14 TaxID=1817824 RepID=A0A1F5NNI1_9BACT|nr:MAG: hypothetical protein A2751_04595 [Candidatus Doudnabacteria bacterium RIFCSPHIGHO2_01_FULL_46_14]
MLRLPAEWEKHDAVWMAWPHDKISFGALNEPKDSPDHERLGRIEKIFLQIIDALQGSEQVNLIVRDKKQHADILEKVRMYETNYADVWTRDYAPSFVIEDAKKLAGIKWEYSAYGSKFPDLLKDNEVFKSLDLGMQLVEPGVLLEDGAIENNGQGTLITTQQCLFARNPNMTKAEFENIFQKHLGVTKVIWLEQGIVGDHTDGHIDEVARFVAPHKIVCAYEDDPSDENYQILQKNYETLKTATDGQWRPFEIIKLPMPHLKYRDGQKAPVSYANFYIANKVVLAGIFNDPHDAEALEILKGLFPERQVIAIDSTDIVYGGGGVHCMTRQQPAII